MVSAGHAQNAYSLASAQMEPHLPPTAFLLFAMLFFLYNFTNKQLK